MAIDNINFSGSVAGEIKAINSICTAVGNKLADIDKQLDNLGGVWQDDKSAQFIRETKEYVAKCQQQQQKAANAARSIMAAVVASTNIYEG